MAAKGVKGAKMTKLESVAHSALQSRVNLNPTEHEVYDKLREKYLADKKRNVQPDAYTNRVEGF